MFNRFEEEYYDFRNFYFIGEVIERNRDLCKSRVDRKFTCFFWKILFKDLFMLLREKSKDIIYERYVNRNWSYVSMDLNFKSIVILI